MYVCVSCLIKYMNTQYFLAVRVKDSRRVVIPTSTVPKHF